MYTAKHAMLYKHRVPDGKAIVFYIDVRTGGKGYHEFVTKAQEEDKVHYIRGKVSKIFKDGDGLVVCGADTLTGEQVEVVCDMVVLAMAMVSSKDVLRLVDKLKITADEHGFITAAHPRLRPIETPISGIYLAGCAQAPKDIPEVVAQASGAASKVAEQFTKDWQDQRSLISCQSRGDEDV
jgi:heterodisulfide reductase subunit A